MRKVLASVDLGSDTIKLVVAEYFNQKINILAAVNVPSKGIKNGFVIEATELLPCLKELLKRGEDILGLPIKKVIVTVPSDDVKFHMNEGTVQVPPEQGFVSNNDLINAMNASTYKLIEEDEQLATIMPITYKVDDQVLKNPVGVDGTTCSVKSIFTTIPRKNISPIIKCFAKLNVEIIDISFTSIGDYFEFQTPKMKELVGAVINLGYTTTTISIFNKGILTNTKTLDMGAEDIENDLSYIYKVPKKDARFIRLNLCLAHKRGVNDSHKKEFSTKTGEKVWVNEYEATQIASSRIEEILKLAKKEINLLTKKEIHYIIITGGISEMVSFNYIVEEIFGHFAKIGVIKELGVRNNIYSTSVGLIKNYLEKLKLRDQEFTILSESEQEDLGSSARRVNINENSILGKLFGYFFDN